jgi:pilus assembly protein TadC
MVILSLLLLGAALLLLAVPALSGMAAARRTQRRLQALCGAARPAAAPRILPQLLAASLWFGDLLLGSDAARKALAEKLAEAGFAQKTAPQLFAAARALGCLAGGGLMTQIGPLGDPLRDAALGALGAFMPPGLALRSLAARRSRMTRADLPVFIDLLIIVLASGLAVEQAIRFIAQLPVSPIPSIAPAVRGFVIDLDRSTPYELCLTRFSDRLGVEEARLVMEVLRQNLVHGTELQQPLRALAVDLRERRVFQARARIGKATTQMTVVMIATLFPALLALLGAPAISTVVEALKGTR